MERTKISRDLDVGKYLMLGIGLVLIVYMVIADDRETLLLPFGIFLSVCAILFFLFHHAKTVEFDQQYLHIRGRQTYVTVPLHRIVMIGLTTTKINKESMWKIVYTDERDEEQSVRILPERKNFRRFTRYMEEHHPGVRVKNWEHAFDSDSW
jgi:hypothetical protein